MKKQPEGNYYNSGKEIIDSEVNKTVAIATYEVGAEIIVKALNYYFGNTFTRNESVEMMCNNTGNSLDIIADFVKKEEYDADEIIRFLKEVSDEMKGQALVVALRDELKFDKPKD